MKKTLISILLLSALTVPLSAVSDSLGSPSVGAGSGVVGHSRNTLPIATPGNVKKAASWTADVITTSINTQITHVGNNIQTAIEKADAENRSQLETQTRANTQSAKDQVKAQARVDSEERYSPESMGTGACTSDKAAGERANSQEVRKVVGSTGTKSVSGHIRSARPYSATTSEIKASLDKSEGGALNLIPEDGVATVEEYQAGAEYIKTTIEPTPSPELPDNITDGASKRTYENLVEWRAQHLELANAVMTDIQVRTAPLIDDEAITLVWENAGFVGEPPNIDGKISQDAYEQVIVDARYRSPDWYSADKGIRRMTEKGLLVEIAEMQAFMIELMHESNKLDRRLALMQAETYARDIQKMTGEPLKKTYAKAIAGKD
jgi:hypothetical protein